MRCYTRRFHADDPWPLTLLELLFNLQRFAHAALFASDSHPWRALDCLEDYFAQLSALFAAPENLLQLQRAEQGGARLENRDQILLGEGTEVEPGAFLKGPLIIGRECEIRHSAYLRGQVIAGDRCILGHSSEFVRSILLDGVKAAHFAYLGDSIVGNDANLGAGTKCANLRFDGAPVMVEIRDRRWPTNRRKLGALIGDGAQTGCNSALNPGSALERGARVPPCSSSSGWVPSPRPARLEQPLASQPMIPR